MAEKGEQRRKKPSCAGALSMNMPGFGFRRKKGKMRVLPDKSCYLRQQSFPPKKTIPGRRVSFSAVLRGSLTTEAAWCVPLFFLAVLSLISMMELYGTYAEKTVHMQETVETAAMYASAAGEASLPVIELWDSFTYRPRWYPEALPGVNLTVRGRVRPWTGRTAEESASVSGGTEDELVYVTDYESVYHTSSSCTHLALTVNAVSGRDVGSMHNHDGSHYHACDKCVGSGGKNTTVYITPEGDCYHNSAACSGLHRSTRLVRKSEVESLPVCSRCLALEGAV